MSTTKKDMPAGAALSPYDTADYLRTPEEIAAYLEAVFEDYGDDSRVIVAALGDAAKAMGMQKVAQETGLNREGLYKALSGEANPSFDTVLKVMGAVGVELRPKAMQSATRKVPSAKEAIDHARSRIAAGRNKTAAPARKRA